MFSATGGRYSLSFSQDQYPLVSDHKIPIFAFPYEKVCTPLHNIYNTPHRHAQTLEIFSSYILGKSSDSSSAKLSDDDIEQFGR